MATFAERLWRSAGLTAASGAPTCRAFQLWTLHYIRNHTEMYIKYVTTARSALLTTRSLRDNNANRVLSKLLTNKLTPWRQNSEVHHRSHQSPPPVPIPSQVNPLHTPPTNLPKVHFDSILLSTSWSFQWSFTFRLSLQNPVHASSLSHACHMPSPPRYL
jgi:hypothetical protein